MKTIGTRLKNLRQRHNFTIDSVAELLEIKPIDLEKIESDTKILTVSQLEVLSDLYLVDEDYITDGKSSTMYITEFHQQNIDINTLYQINKILRNIDFLVSLI